MIPWKDRLNLIETLKIPFMKYIKKLSSNYYILSFINHFLFIAFDKIIRHIKLTKLKIRQNNYKPQKLKKKTH